MASRAHHSSPLPLRVHPTEFSSPTVSSPLSAATPPSLKHNISLQKPRTQKGPTTSKKLFRRLKAVFRAFPIITPLCKIPSCTHGNLLYDGHIHGGRRMTGTLFGHRKSRVNLAVQENPSSFPILLLELTLPTGKLLQDMGMGLLRIALECEKKPHDKTKIIDEPIWTMYCNGLKSGYGIKREPTDEDFIVMETLRVISMGAGVIPTIDNTKQLDEELTYMRAYFERVVVSKDFETYYMMNPDANNGPELSIFFARI